MLDLVVVTLLQAVAGAPADAPSVTAPTAAEASQTSESAQNEASQTDARERVRCRTRANVGSRLGTRVCSTRRQDQDATNNARSAIDSIQRQNWVREP
jgi:hypothetical protein